MEYLRIVMRNRSTRRDAAYIVTIEDADDERRQQHLAAQHTGESAPSVYTVTGHWGQWRQYELSPTSLDNLRSQVKATTSNWAYARSHARGLFDGKLRKGYRQIGTWQESNRRDEAERRNHQEANYNRVSMGDDVSPIYRTPRRRVEQRWSGGQVTTNVTEEPPPPLPQDKPKPKEPKARRIDL